MCLISINIVLFLLAKNLLATDYVDDEEWTQNIMKLMDTPEFQEMMVSEGLIEPKNEKVPASMPPKGSLKKGSLNDLMRQTSAVAGETSMASIQKAYRQIHLEPDTPLQMHSPAVEYPPAFMPNTLRLNNEPVPKYNNDKKRKAPIEQASTAESPMRNAADSQEDPVEKLTLSVYKTFNYSIAVMGLQPSAMVNVMDLLESGLLLEDQKVQELLEKPIDQLSRYNSTNQILIVHKMMDSNQSFANFAESLNDQIVKIFGRNLLSIRPLQAEQKKYNATPYDDIVKLQLIKQRGYTVDGKLMFVVEKYAVVLFFYIRLYRRLCGSLEAPYLGTQNYVELDKRRALLFCIRGMMKLFIREFRNCLNMEDKEQEEMFTKLLQLDHHLTAAEVIKMVALALQKNIKSLIGEENKQIATLKQLIDAFNVVSKKCLPKSTQSIIDKRVIGIHNHNFRMENVACIVLLKGNQEQEKSIANLAVIEHKTPNLGMTLAYNGMLLELMASHKAKYAKEESEQQSGPTTSQQKVPKLFYPDQTPLEIDIGQYLEQNGQNIPTKMPQVIRKLDLLSEFYGTLLALMDPELESVFSDPTSEKLKTSWELVKNFLVVVKDQVDQALNLWKHRNPKEPFEMFMSDFLIETKCGL